MFDLFAFTVAALALVSRHRWKNIAKDNEYFLLRLAADRLKEMNKQQLNHGKQTIDIANRIADQRTIWISRN